MAERIAYQIVSDTSEDRSGEAESLEQAVRLARSVVSEGHARVVCIEHLGLVIRQLTLTPVRMIEEEVLAGEGKNARF